MWRRIVTVSSLRYSSSYTLPKPRLLNAYSEDEFIQSVVDVNFPQNMRRYVVNDLSNFGQRVINDLQPLADECERVQPQLLNSNCWGKEQNELVLTPAWTKIKAISAEEGMVSTGYERKTQSLSRLHQFIKLLLYQPSSGMVGCPMAMTDGAAKILSSLPTKCRSPLVQESLQRLLSRDPNLSWTSGQWMTEKRGGSDVANSTETIAVQIGRKRLSDQSSAGKQSNMRYKLYGYKFFSSAADSDISMSLARETDEDSDLPIEGHLGLTLFLLKTMQSDGTPNGIHMTRLKSKYGTRQLPTAELLLDGTVAERISETGRGVASIATMLQVTRIYCVMGATSYLRRGVLMSMDYANRREAFGHRLIDLPLHSDDLHRLDALSRVGILFTTQCALMLGTNENSAEGGSGLSASEKAWFRLLLPLAKAFICKQSVHGLSEIMETFGGQGYMEDSGIPVLLRDCQVNAIWEGTTNIQCLDVIRVLRSNEGAAALSFLREDTESLVQDLPVVLEAVGVYVLRSVVETVDFIKHTISSDNERNDILLSVSKYLTFELAAIYGACLLLRHAATTQAESDISALKTWCATEVPRHQHLQRLSKSGFFVEGLHRRATTNQVAAK